MRVFWGELWKSPLKQRIASLSNGEVVGRMRELAGNAPVRNGHPPIAAEGRPHAPTRRTVSESSEIGVEVGDGLDATEIIFERDVFIGSMGVFVRQTEAEQDARHLEGVVHLGHERDGTALANENGLLAEAFFESGLRFLENRSLVRSHPRFSSAQDFKLAMDRFRNKLSNVFLHELGDLVRILIGHQARGEFSKSL